SPAPSRKPRTGTGPPPSASGPRTPTPSGSSWPRQPKRTSWSAGDDVTSKRIPRSAVQPASTPPPSDTRRTAPAPLPPPVPMVPGCDPETPHRGASTPNAENRQPASPLLLSHPDHRPHRRGHRASGDGRRIPLSQRWFRLWPVAGPSLAAEPRSWRRRGDRQNDRRQRSRHIMRYVRKYFPLIAALGLAMAACGDDDTTNPASGELTETEATALAALLAADGFADSQSAGSTAAPGLSAAPFGPQPATRVVFTIEDETHPCRLGGTRTLNASLEIVAGEAESDPV